MFVDQIEGEERMAEMIEHAHKNDEIEFLVEGTDFPDGEAAKIDVGREHIGGKARLREVVFIGIDAENSISAAAFHLDGIEAGVAADIEHGFASQVTRKGVAEALELGAWIISEEVVGCGLDSIEAKIVEPGAERSNALLEPGSLVSGAN